MCLVFASQKEWFGSYPAEELMPQEIEKTLARAAREEGEVGSLYLQPLRSLMSLS